MLVDFTNYNYFFKESEFVKLKLCSSQIQLSQSCWNPYNSTVSWIPLMTVFKESKHYWQRLKYWNNKLNNDLQSFNFFMESLKKMVQEKNNKNINKNKFVYGKRFFFLIWNFVFIEILDLLAAMFIKYQWLGSKKYWSQSPALHKIIFYKIGPFTK